MPSAFLVQALIPSPLLPQWYGGGASRSAAPTQNLAAGDDVVGSATRLPGRLKATTAPRIKGKPRVGRTLRVTKGAWNQMTGTTFRFTWLRGATAVGHAAHRGDGRNRPWIDPRSARVAIPVVAPGHRRLTSCNALAPLL